MFDYKQIAYTDKGRMEHERILGKVNRGKPKKGKLTKRYQIDCIGSDKCQINFARMKELIKCQCGILYLKDSPRYDKETNACDWCKKEKKEKPGKKPQKGKGLLAG